MKKIDDYEAMLIDYCEANPLVKTYQNIINRYEQEQKTPEYNKQQYTFKYGNYSYSNMLATE